MTPQQKRVLDAARSYRGTCSADWSDEMGADGKGKILRVPARIEELENDHRCVFEIVGWRNKTKVYRLIEEPVSVPAVGGDTSGFSHSPREGGAPAGVSPNGQDSLFPLAGVPHWKSEAA